MSKASNQSVLIGGQTGLVGEVAASGEESALATMKAEVKVTQRGILLPQAHHCKIHKTLSTRLPPTEPQPNLTESMGSTSPQALSGVSCNQTCSCHI